MAYHAAVLADSIGPHGHRLTTFEVTFPRMVLADMTRHRALSYSFESTRAVPTERRIEQAKTDPYVPTFRRRTKGMGGGEELNPTEQAQAQDLWLRSCSAAIEYAEQLLWTGKEHVGRILEPYTWITGIVSGTEWENFFALRSPPPNMQPDPAYPAQFELQQIAYDMEQLYRARDPEALDYGEWHLPLLNPMEKLASWAAPYSYAMASAGRCAAVSYLNHHKAGETIDESVQRWEKRLAPSAHWSPGEHPAMCVRPDQEYNSNFDGWCQLRKFYPDEAVRPRHLQG